MATPKSKPGSAILYRPNLATLEKIDRLVESGKYTDRVNVVETAVQRFLEWDTYMAEVSVSLERSLQNPEVIRAISEAVAPIVMGKIKESL